MQSTSVAVSDCQTSSRVCKTDNIFFLADLLLSISVRDSWDNGAVSKTTCSSLSKATLSSVSSEILEAETWPRGSRLWLLFELGVYRTHEHALREAWQPQCATVQSEWTCVSSGLGWYLHNASTVSTHVIKMLPRGESVPWLHQPLETFFALILTLSGTCNKLTYLNPREIWAIVTSCIRVRLCLFFS